MQFKKKEEARCPRDLLLGKNLHFMKRESGGKNRRVMTFFVDFSDQRLEQLIYFISQKRNFPEWNTLLLLLLLFLASHSRFNFLFCSLFCPVSKRNSWRENRKKWIGVNGKKKKNKKESREKGYKGFNDLKRNRSIRRGNVR